MGRSPCCAKEGLNKGAWTATEDRRLVEYVTRHGEGKWPSLPKETGLKRCGKSCRLRWLNYLRPDIKRGNISPDEEDLIIRLHRLLGNKWSLIAGRLPGRTDNEIKNYWNTNFSKKLASNKNNIKKQQQQQISAQSPLEKNKEFPSSITHQLNFSTSSHRINKICTAGSNPESDKKEDSWTLDEGELDTDFNLEELMNFTGLGVNEDSTGHVNINAGGCSSSNADDHQHNDSNDFITKLRDPEYSLPLQGEIDDHHQESSDFTLVFDGDHWLLDMDALGCVNELI